MSNAIQVKMFLGFPVTSEIKMHLKKDASQNHDLKEVRFQDREYMGISIESSLSLQKLKLKETEVIQLLKTHCPKLAVEKQKLFLFPEVFVS